MNARTKNTRSLGGPGRRRGSALVLVTVLLTLVGIVAVSSLGLAGSALGAASAGGRRHQAERVADAGLELARAYFADLGKKTTALGPNPFIGYESLHLADLLGGARDITTPAGDVVGQVAASVYVLGADPAAADARWVDPLGQPLVTHQGVLPSVYSVAPGGASAQPLNRRDIVVFVSAAVPSFASPTRGAARKEIALSVNLAASEVFDYAYFMHNWGWMAGPNGWTFNGNMRSNASFSWLGGCTLNGTPRFDHSDSLLLSDAARLDDNGDGSLTNDGGTYAFVQVDGNPALGAQKDRYDSDQVDVSANQYHPPQVTLPNINRQEYYDALAADHVRLYDDDGTRLATPNAANTGARVGVYDPTDPAADATTGYVWYERIIGDDEGKANVVLVGDATHPIIIDGPVVVRGAVLIQGTVTGQGALYAKENIYVTGSVTYADGPTSPRPASNSTDDINAWRGANAEKDALGLFSAENVFFGKGDGPTGYFNQSENQNRERTAGMDQTNNTPDDNGGAGPGTWEVDAYTAADVALLNPTNDPQGPQVGAPIPGSGEDVDADGVEDDRSSVRADFTLPGVDQTTAPNSFGTANGNFGGGNRVLDSAWLGARRLPGWSPADGGSRYRDVAGAANHVDAVIYSNHFVAGSMSGGPTCVNGAVIARNEALYASAAFQINHDSRLLGGGAALGMHLPREWKPTTVIYVRTTSGLE